MAEFGNKVVVVTGGGGGIGKATAARFLEEGAAVVLSGRRQAMLEAVQRQLDPAGDRLALLADDVSSAAAAERLVQTAIERFGSVDVVGLPPTDPDSLAEAAAELPVDQWMGTSGA